MIAWKRKGLGRSAGIRSGAIRNGPLRYLLAYVLVFLAKPSLAQQPEPALAQVGDTGAVFGHPNGQDSVAVTPARGHQASGLARKTPSRNSEGLNSGAGSRLLEGGIWAQVDLEYRPADDEDRGQKE